MNREDFQAFQDTEAVTIASGASASGAITVNGMIPGGILLPATMTGTNILFTGSIDNGATYVPLRSDSADFSFAISGATGKLVSLSPTMREALRLCTHFKILTGTDHSNLTNQGADRALTVVFFR